MELVMVFHQFTVMHISFQKSAKQDQKRDITLKLEN